MNNPFPTPQSVSHWFHNNNPTGLTNAYKVISYSSITSLTELFRLIKSEKYKVITIKLYNSVHYYLFFNPNSVDNAVGLGRNREYCHLSCILHTLKGDRLIFGNWFLARSDAQPINLQEYTLILRTSITRGDSYTDHYLLTDRFLKLTYELKGKSYCLMTIPSTYSQEFKVRIYPSDLILQASA